jgi:hypothetical protein
LIQRQKLSTVAKTNSMRWRVCAALLAHGHRQGVAEDEHVADQPLEGAAQIGARHHRVSDHVEARRPHHLRLGQRQRRVARALDRELPQAADLLGLQPRPGSRERGRVDPGRRQESAGIKALGGKHLGGALDPDRCRGPFGHPFRLPLAMSGQ